MTDRPVLLLKAQDGTFIEIFEWESEETKDRAYQLPGIREIWGKMMEIAWLNHEMDFCLYCRKNAG